jgi:hypothetical protein
MYNLSPIKCQEKNYLIRALQEKKQKKVKKMRRGSENYSRTKNAKL